MIPSPSRIVHYTLTEEDATRIYERSAPSVGNQARAGDVFPMIIVRVWGSEEGSAVNGQVFLDGNDTLWVTSVTEGEGPGHWFVPPRV